MNLYSLDYIKFIKDSFWFSIKNRKLWLFGFLLTVFWPFEIINSNISNEQTENIIKNSIIILEENPNLLSNKIYIIGIFILILIILLVSWYFRALSKSSIFFAGNLGKGKIKNKALLFQSRKIIKRLFRFDLAFFVIEALFILIFLILIFLFGFYLRISGVFIIIYILISSLFFVIIQLIKNFSWRVYMISQNGVKKSIVESVKIIKKNKINTVFAGFYLYIPLFFIEILLSFIMSLASPLFWVIAGLFVSGNSVLEPQNIIILFASQFLFLKLIFSFLKGSVQVYYENYMNSFVRRIFKLCGVKLGPARGWSPSVGKV